MTTTKQVMILWLGGEMPPELEALQTEGHVVHTNYCPGPTADQCVPIEQYDLVMGPKCWRIMPEQMKFLPLAIKEARAAQPKRPRANTQRKAKDPAV